PKVGFRTHHSDKVDEITPTSATDKDKTAMTTTIATAALVPPVSQLKVDVNASGCHVLPTGALNSSTTQSNGHQAKGYDGRIVYHSQHHHQQQQQQQQQQQTTCAETQAQSSFSYLCNADTTTTSDTSFANELSAHKQKHDLALVPPLNNYYCYPNNHKSNEAKFEFALDTQQQPLFAEQMCMITGLPKTKIFFYLSFFFFFFFFWPLNWTNNSNKQTNKKGNNEMAPTESLYAYQGMTEFPYYVNDRIVTGGDGSDDRGHNHNYFAVPMPTDLSYMGLQNHPYSQVMTTDTWAVNNDLVNGVYLNMLSMNISPQF
ncbi:hypothetical protein RFI_28063, partial [Reticulomyxa filosa]